MSLDINFHLINSKYIYKILNIINEIKEYNIKHDIISFRSNKCVYKIFTKYKITSDRYDVMSPNCISLYYEYRNYIQQRCKFHYYLIRHYLAITYPLIDYDKLLCKLPLNNEIKLVLVNYNIHMTALYCKYTLLYEKIHSEFNSKYRHYSCSIDEHCFNIEKEMHKHFPYQYDFMSSEYTPEINKELCDKIINCVNQINQLCIEFKNKVNEFNIEYEREIKIINECRCILDNYIVSID